MTVDWPTLTQARAARLIGAADQAEKRAAQRWNASDDPADEAAWREAFDLWENLRVYALCGEKPE